MHFRFASIGSGSSGNGTLVQAGNTVLLLDCGFSCKEVCSRLARLELKPEDVDAIVITHEHQDHIRGAGAFSRKYNIPVWTTYGTFQAGRMGDPYEIQILSSFRPCRIGDIEIQPVPVPHDAREPVQFVFSAFSKRLGVLTDLGHITVQIQKMYSGLDALSLESNHDIEMLRTGRYSPALKQRVGGDYGHLSNAQAVSLASDIVHDKLQHLVVAHLSLENNNIESVETAFAPLLSQIQDGFHIACQEQGFSWKTIT